MEEQQRQSKPKNWFVRHKLWTAGLVLIALLIIGSAGKGSNETKQNSTASTARNTSASKSAKFESQGKEQPAAKAYVQVFTFTGNGAKKSEPFKITGDRFKVRYDCKGDLCQAFLHATDSDAPKEVLMNTQGTAKDETVVYGPGEYYIQANTLGTYTIVVEDYR